MSSEDTKLPESKPVKTGKRPIKERKKLIFGEFALDNDQLSLSKALKKEMEDQGYEWRFIDRKQFVQNSAVHKWGWQPYQRVDQENDTLSLSEDLIGKSPEGYIQRGTAVLAVRPIEYGDKHREMLKQKADRVTSSKVVKEQAAELRKKARDMGFKATIVEGDDE